MPLPFCPRAYHLRRKLEESTCRAEAVIVGRQAIDELERLLTWTRSLGLVPPEERLADDEISEGPRWRVCG